MTACIRLIAFASALCLHCAAAWANDLPPPRGDVILIVTGDLDVTNIDDTAQFDRPLLDALGTRTIETTTIWTEGLQSFTGVPLKTLADRLEISAGRLRAVAINDYSIDIPMAHVTEDSAILAYERNGAPMSVREKGPIWLVYPYDDDPKFRTETYHSRSVWQLREIVVER